MRDIATDITGRADGRKSKDGAVKDAMQDLLNNLQAAGHKISVMILDMHWICIECV